MYFKRCAKGLRCSLTMRLSTTLEIEVADVGVSEGEFYQCLIGGDLLNGKPGMLGPAVISLGVGRASGNVQWRQPKSGCVAIAEFLRPTPSKNAVGPKLPPAPTPANRYPQSAILASTFDAKGVTLSPIYVD